MNLLSTNYTKINDSTFKDYKDLTNKIIKTYLIFQFKNNNKKALQKSRQSFSTLTGHLNINLKDSIAFIQLVENAINNLPENEREIFESYYFNSQNNKNSYYCKSWYYRLLKRAIKHFCELIVW